MRREVSLGSSNNLKEKRLGTKKGSIVSAAMSRQIRVMWWITACHEAAGVHIAEARAHNNHLVIAARQPYHFFFPNVVVLAADSPVR
jgi:hypothetical protein